MAQLSLHFGKFSQHISEKELNKYLAQLACQRKTPTLPDFKHTVYGIRYCYCMHGMAEKNVQLPQIIHENKLSASTYLQSLPE